MRSALFDLRVPTVVGALLAMGFSALALDPARALTQYGQQVWRMEDGLPQHSVQAIHQTRDGYLWLGTQGGLARFDGERFTVYGTHNVPALKSDFFFSLFEDSKGALWAGTDGGGAVRLKDGVFTALTTRDGVTSNRVCSVLEDRQGRYWFGTLGAGLNLLEKGRVRAFGRKDGLPSDTILALLEDCRGTLWVGTDSGLAYLSGGRFEVFPLDRWVRSPEVRMRVRALCEDAEGALWAGTYHGLFKIKTGQATLYTRADGLCQDEVMSLYFEKTPRILWVGTYNGLNRMYNGRFESFTGNEGLVGEQVWSLAGDREGSLWFGTVGGLNRFRDTKFYTIGAREGLVPDQVYAVLEAADGSLWIGTDGGGAGRLSGGRLTVYTTRAGLTSDKVRCFLEEPDGTLLIGTDGGGIVRFAKGRFSPFLPERTGPLLKTDVVGLQRDAEGTLWVACRPGVFVLRGGRLEEITADRGLSDPNATCLFQDSSYRLWLGTDGGGLFYWEEGRFHLLSEKDGLSSNYVTTLAETPAGTRWIATYTGGLNRLKDGHFTRIGTEQGLRENVIYALLDDGAGSFWLSGNRGISRVFKRDLDEVASGRLSVLPCEGFGRSDGMGTDECNGGTQSAATRTRGGLLCFSTMAGLAVMDPRRLTVNRLPPPVRIELVVVDGRATDPRRAMELPPGRHRLEFQYTALSLAAPDKNRFKYRLWGFDSDWVDAGAGRRAVYTIQQPGEYRFRVLGANNDGIWNEQGDACAFRLKPHFYETAWFYALCAFALALSAWGLYSLRVRQLKARQEELEGLVLERTQDLAAEREKSEELLLNILPPDIAERKKAGEGTIADHYSEVAILFADLVDFSALSALMAPEDLVRLLDAVFSEFDRLADLRGLEKIKTIGDCYMAVAGIPEPMMETARAAADLALDLLDAVARLGSELGVPLQVRIGLHAGEAVAGVIGKKKFSYDIWSDAVNTASRMESHGEPGRIHCSERIHDLLSTRYLFEARGEVPIKGKGVLRTWFLLGRKPGMRGVL